MKKTSFLLLFLTIIAPLCAGNYGFKLIRTIGDDRDDYTFFKIHASAVAPDGSVYVGDGGAYFVARYDPEGSFVGRIGQYGQGPTDFGSIRSLRFFDNSLYFSDVRNARLGEIDSELKKMHTFKPGAFIPFGDFSVLSANRFLCTVSNLDTPESKSRVAVFNAEGKIERLFFSRDQWGEAKWEKDEWQRAQKMTTSMLLAAHAPDRREVVIGFRYPVNPSAFYVHDLEGRELSSFTIPHKAGFKFPEHLNRYPLEASERHFFLVNRALFVYREFYLLFCDELETRIKANSEIKRSYCQVLSAQGRVLAEIDLPTGLEVFDVNRQGYLVGSNKLDDEPLIYLYQISF